MEQAKEMSFFQDLGLNPLTDPQMKDFMDHLLLNVEGSGAVVDIYNKWAPTYDEDASGGRPHSGPKACALKVSEIFQRKDIRILDVAAGTGILGKCLQTQGFENIDSLDPSIGMVAIAKERKIYKNFIEEFIGCETPCSIQNGTYDCVTCSGALIQGHVPTTSFREMCRILKKGGRAVIDYCQDFVTGHETYDDSLWATIEELQKEKIWELKSKEKIAGYSTGSDGILFDFQIL